MRIGSDDLTWETLTAAVEQARDGIADRADAAERELVEAGRVMRRVSAEVERATIRQRAAITEAAAAGMSPSAIAEAVGLSRQRVHRILHV